MMMMSPVLLAVVGVGAYLLFGAKKGSSSGPSGGIGAKQPTEGETSSGASLTLVSGDLASSLALWYTGVVGRWTELPSANDGMRIVSKGGRPYGLAPWQPGQIVFLPEGWDASRGRAPVGYGVASTPIEIVEGGVAVPESWIPDGQGGFMPPDEASELEPEIGV